MNVDWSPLRLELATWRADNLTLPFWWRDDDAVAATPDLDQLAHLSQDTGVPVHLAVIPANAEPNLADLLSGPSSLIPVIHGWAHRNTAPAASKKSEFGHRRMGAEMELEQALIRMKTLFGSSLVQAFVAPWNRLHPSYLQTLADLGYDIVSTFQARETQYPVPDLRAINTHVDPIDWRGTRDLLDPEQILTTTVNQLQARRKGHTDNSEPFGYLTHHLVHTSDVWAFSQSFINELLDGGAQPTTLTQALEETT